MAGGVLDALRPQGSPVDPGLRPGRRQGRPEPGRPGHADGVGVEGRDRHLGDRGCQAAQLAQGAALDAVAAPDGLPAHAVPTTGTAATKFTTPGGVEVKSVILNPVPIPQGNLDLVVDAGWVYEEVCQV